MEVLKAYGGKQESEGYFSKDNVLYNSNSNAYMLVYKLVTGGGESDKLTGKFEEVKHISEEEVPQYLKGILE